MGARGGRHPEGLEQRTLRTLFLRAPYSEYAALIQGHKTEFRVPNMGAIADAYVAPTPVMLYATSPSRRERISGLVTLVEHRQERLVEIADKPISLSRERCDTYDDFRRYWRERTHRPYRPLDVVEVFHIKPYSSGDAPMLGLELLKRLYGDHAVERTIRHL